MRGRTIASCNQVVIDKLNVDNHTLKEACQHKLNDDVSKGKINRPTVYLGNQLLF
jgi:hypothetical protein